MSKQVYKSFTKPHPIYKLIQNKKWGVALLPLPNTFEEYLTGKSKQALRTNRKHALSRGFHFERFDPKQRILEILSINSSLPSRQGKLMNASYLDISKLEMLYAEIPNMFGVFDKGDCLKAYAYTPICGEFFVFSRLLGHADNLEDGVMYLLMSEIIREMIVIKNNKSDPKWAMYDTFFGATLGLQYFKKRLGFQPYKVIWQWVERKHNPRESISQ
ncbi:MAG: hypothetical protein U0350_03745 [Caldilineaceae bacterium]